LLFHFRYQANKVPIMAFGNPEVVSERTPVLSQPYDKREFYIGLCLAISSSVFIGKFPFEHYHWHICVTDILSGRLDVRGDAEGCHSNLPTSFKQS
jgi:hypothetical protein